MKKFSSEIGADPDPDYDIRQTGERYTFLTKAATKKMRVDKKTDVKYVFIEIGDELPLEAVLKFQAPSSQIESANPSSNVSSQI